MNGEEHLEPHSNATSTSRKVKKYMEDIFGSGGLMYWFEDLLHFVAKISENLSQKSHLVFSRSPYVMLYYSILCYITWYYIILSHLMLYYIIICYAILYDIILCYAIKHYMILYYVMLYDIILYYIKNISYCIIFYFFTLLYERKENIILNHTISKS